MNSRRRQICGPYSDRRRTAKVWRWQNTAIIKVNPYLLVGMNIVSDVLWTLYGASEIVDARIIESVRRAKKG